MPLVDELAALDIPVLILVGSGIATPVSTPAATWSTAFDRHTFRVFDDSAHFPNAEETDRYVDEIAAFLASRSTSVS